MADLLLGDAQIPVNDVIVRPSRPGLKFDPLAGLVTDVWIEYFSRIVSVVGRSVTRVGAVNLTGQSASIGATDMTNGTYAAGFYLVHYFCRVTSPATTSSSLTVVLDWVHGAANLSYTAAALTGNTTSTYGYVTIPIMIDGASPVRYSTTYASVGASAMQYTFHAAIQTIQI